MLGVVTQLLIVGLAQLRLHLRTSAADRLVGLGPPICVSMGVVAAWTLAFYLLFRRRPSA